MSSPYYYQSDPYGSGRRSSQQPRSLQPIQSAIDRQSTSSSVLPDTSSQTQPLYENETQQAGHYWERPASGSTFLPSRDSQVTSSHQQPIMATNTFAPSSQYSQTPVPVPTPQNSGCYGGGQQCGQFYAPLQGVSYHAGGYNAARTHIPPFSTQDSKRLRHVHSPHPHGSPPRQRQDISVLSNPLYTSHPQSERRGQQDYPQPHWQQQQQSPPPRSADPRYPDPDHTPAPSQPFTGSLPPTTIMSTINPLSDPPPTLQQLAGVLSSVTEATKRMLDSSPRISSLSPGRLDSETRYEMSINRSSPAPPQPKF
ncbi:hypothetical protein BJV78DRAFT_549147 [Lactifluus subvellereus]|nr:hypothetical protein BJV78DRAFT_549147 [Lactifluus subvellereus]